MKSLDRVFKSREEGKGTAGCIFALVLMLIVIFFAVKLAPPYLNRYEFKSELKQAVSRAGARAFSDENIKKDLLLLAEKNKIVLKSENIRIKHVAGQLVISVEYTIPVDFIILKHDLSFQDEESSFTIV